MMHSKIIGDVYGLLATPEWAATAIKAYPRNYQGQITARPYALVTVLPSKKKQSTSAVGARIDGLIILSVFVDTTKGDAQLFAIGDTLSTIFEKRTLANGTTTDMGSMKPIGIDPDNSSLYRGDYSVPFTLHGE